MTRGLCIAIHDVAPGTWPECAALLGMLDRLGPSLPVTLLVVPDYHRAGRVDAAPGFLRAVDAHVAAGAEIALHGYYHLDEAPAPRQPAAWLRRRLLTDGEGEFAALTTEEAAARIARGRATLEACGWHVAGFVPPAWLAGEAAGMAIRRCSLGYTSSRFGLTRLSDGASISAPCITASARSPWRRLGSRLWLAAMEAATAQAPLLRVALHPADARDPGILRRWARLIERLLLQRRPLTKHQALERYGCAAPSR